MAVAVAFNAGNLLAVSLAQREKFPTLRLIICADDDVHNPTNPGLNRARYAARAARAWVATPDFGPDRPDDLTDFNDLHRLSGLAAVKTCIDQAVFHGDSPAGAYAGWPATKLINAELKPVPPFDPETLLPEGLRGWIMDEAERMPCPPDFIAAAALVALGSLIGARCAMKPKAFDIWLVIPNLWGAIVGDPSAKKTPAWGAALGPLNRLIAKAVEEQKEASLAYDTDKMVFDAEHEAIAARIRKRPKTCQRGYRQYRQGIARAHGLDSGQTEPAALQNQ